MLNILPSLHPRSCKEVESELHHDASIMSNEICLAQMPGKTLFKLLFYTEWDFYQISGNN